MATQHNLTSAQGNGNSVNGATAEGHTGQQLLATLENLQAELEQADWTETEPIRERIRKVTELVSTSSFLERNGQDSERASDENLFASLANKILQTKDLDSLSHSTTQELRQSLQCDRVAIYRFNPDWSGEFIADSAGSEWVSLLQEQRNNPAIVENVNACSVKDLASDRGLVGATSHHNGADTYLRRTQGSAFSRGQLYRVANDIHNSGFSECYIKILDAYQAKAYVIAAIYQGQQLWGLLAAYQNSGARQWLGSEIDLVVRAGTLFGVALQQSQYLQQIQTQTEELAKRAEQERAFAKIADRIRQSQDLKAVFNVTTSEVRQLLQCDRVAIYRFNPDWSGEFIADSAGSEWVSLLQEQCNNPAIVENVNACSVMDLAGNRKLAGATAQSPSLDTHIQQTQGSTFNRKKLYRVANDIYNSGFSDCYINVLESYQAKAYIIVAIYQGQQLWGLLAAYQNSGARQWMDEEIQMLVKIANQFSIAVQQARYLKQIEVRNEELVKSAEQEQVVAKMVDRIRQSQDLDAIFKVTTSEIRRLLQCDRVVVYRFYPDWSGEVIAESVEPSWISLLEEQERDGTLKTELMSSDRCSVKEYGSPTKLDTDTYLRDTKGGRYAKGLRYRKVNDIYAANFAPCYLESLEKFQTRAYLNVPLFLEGQLWGLLLVYQNSGPRQWQDDEAELLVRIGNQFSLAVQQAQYLKQIQIQNAEITRSAEEERTVARLVEQIAEKINQAQDLVKIFQSTLPDARLLLQCDRLAVYRFNPDWSGEIVAESVGSSWVSLVDPDIQTVLADEHLQKTQGGRYRNNESFAVDDIYTAGHSQCYLKLLEQFQARAYAIAPIFAGKKLWGLLGAYQNSEPRQWKSEEVRLLTKLGTQFGIAIQLGEYAERLRTQNTNLSRAAEAERAFTRVVEKIRNSQELEPVFRNTLPEMRQSLHCDRLAVYRFNPNWSGEYIAESVSSDWASLVGPDIRTVWEDDYLMETQGGRYRNNETFVINDVYTAGHSQCHLDILEQFQVKAYVLAPILAGNRLWGLLGAYQNSGSRQWKPEEVQLLTKLGAQLGIGVQQAEYLEQLQTKNAELARAAAEERALARIVEKIRQTQDLSQLFRNNLSDLRQLLHCDRLAVYRFNPDWSGEFIAESVGSDWIPLVGPDIKTVWEDDHLMETQGGRYRNNETFVINDVYTAGHSQCHLDILVQFQIKAYVLAPIFAGNKLWGILGAYQNSSSRQWKSEEVQLLTKLGAQLGIGVQQAEYLDQLKIKNIELAELAEKEKLAKEQLQQGALRVLQALQPSFHGDLTVRAPLSEDEIGTIADGYNTTIQSLRELVRQVQGVAARVSETSNSNTTSVTELSTQAQQQLEKLTHALEQLQLMVTSTQAVATDAQKVEHAVQEANRTVQAGDSLMERTVDGILEIRETVSETAKKIKRLGEASQKISRVVSLIENFATQTNLLALNAAIEATRAGEYGKGFAVVADEVRSLAYQSANATTEIGRLVQEIQAGTNEVTEAMEVGITQVVQGTNLMNETRQSLSAIVAATSQISGLVQAITQAASTQSQQSQVLTEAMTAVSTIAYKTSESSTRISHSFQELLATSQELQTSVSQFKVD